VRQPVEVPGNERTHLQQWLTKRCGWTVHAPELDTTGLKLVGGRLLPGPSGPASFLMYESASGERFTVYTAKAETEATQMRYTKRDNNGALFWADRGVGYVVGGAWPRQARGACRRVRSDATRKTAMRLALHAGYEPYEPRAGLRPDGEERRAAKPEGERSLVSQFRH